MRTFIECAIQSVAFNRNDPLLLNNNLRSNINHKLQFNNNRNNLKKNTEIKNQAGWCIEDFIGNIANKTTATTTKTTATRSSPSSLQLSLMSCFNQLTASSLSSVLASTTNSSSNDYSSSPSSASSAKKTNLFYHHRKAFRRKEDYSLQQNIANITIIAIMIEYLLFTITNALLLSLTVASLVGSINVVTTRS